MALQKKSWAAHVWFNWDWVWLISFWDILKHTLNYWRFFFSWPCVDFIVHMKGFEFWEPRFFVLSAEWNVRYCLHIILKPIRITSTKANFYHLIGVTCDWSMLVFVCLCVWSNIVPLLWVIWAWLKFLSALIRVVYFAFEAKVFDLIGTQIKRLTY